MGFRFSRRLSILPGLSLNLSGSGVSLSAGVRGAHVNLGSCGLYASAGIPGTGLSYRQRLDGASTRSYDRPAGERRPTSRQLEAMQRRADEVGEERAKQSAIEVEWDAYQRRLKFWQPLPEIPTLENFLSAQTPQAFASTLQPPAEPNWELAQARCLEELTDQFKAQLPYKLLPDFMAEQKAKTLLPDTWPLRQQELQQHYQEQVSAYEQQVQAAQVAWDTKEVERVACPSLRLGN
ncbi:MAG: hypothetical protein RLZZ350_1947 [Verrucomicrobiota bacterium]|jgi:hypothetical protein